MSSTKRSAQPQPAAQPQQPGSTKRIPRLQRALMLSSAGYSDLKKATAACTLTNCSILLPASVLLLFIMELVAPLTGGEVDWTRMWLLCGAAVVALLAVFLCTRLDYKLTYISSYMQGERMRVDTAEHIRRLPMSLFNSKDLSELTTNLIGDVATIEHVLSHLVPQLAANGISITLICAALSAYDWRMALAIFVSVPLAFAIIFIARRVYGAVSKRQAAAKLAAADKVQEYIDGMKVIRACNLDGERFSTLEKALRLLMRLQIQMEFGTGVFITGAQAVLQLGVGLTVLVGATLLTGGQLEFIPLLLFLLIVTRVYAPVNAVLTLLPELFYYQITIQRLRTLLEVQPMKGNDQIVPPSFDLCFEDVDFAYNTGLDKVVHGLSLRIPQGSITALVGPSGSGKSTITRLAARFWDVDAGRITLGGVDLREYDPEHLMGFMSFVFQDVVLFNDTVAANIRVGRADATDIELREVARLACCDDFIARLPQGFDTMLGENGATLSGGERQRISIARALLKDAPIVLLDEATASLDPENEALIQQALSTLIEGKTVLVIAHRLRTVAGVDKIVVLESGRIAQQGSHEELLASGGLYQRLFELQQQSQGWSL